AASIGRAAQSRIAEHRQGAVPQGPHFKSRLVFITFEGTEGSGKSVQAEHLIARLRDAGIPAVLTHEPGGTPLGMELRQLVLMRDELAVSARAEALLMNTSRAQLVEQVIRPALQRGEIVVCDRFADSTLAYQGAGRGLD